MGIKIGVFLCECGGNISGSIDLEEVRRAVSLLPEVALVRVQRFLCSQPGLSSIQRAVKKQRLGAVVVASCSPLMHERTFQLAVAQAGLNPYMLVHVNLREQCSWVHGRGAETNHKAVALVAAGVARARHLQPLESERVPLKRDVIVIGGGVAGITAALQLASLGHQVHLVERQPSIGGHMAQLSKVFPNLDCAPCILSPRLADVAAHPHIKLWTETEVTALRGGPGNFQVTLTQQGRGVDTSRCVRCGKCAEACPVEVPHEFEAGLYQRKAIYLPFDQAVPSSYVVDGKHCTSCGACREACPTGAVTLQLEQSTHQVEAGAIIVATGFSLIDPSMLSSYRIDLPGVVTGLQLERLVENELAAGRVLRTASGGRVKSIAFILCAGSRDPHRGVSYCSRVCCPYTIKQAILLKEKLPYLRIWVYYTDLRMSGRGLEEFYRRARELGIRFVHGKPAEVTPSPEGDGRLVLVAEDRDTGLLLRNTVDLVVLATALVPQPGAQELAEVLGVPVGADGFIAERHPKLAPVSTLREGIFAAGCALAPKSIGESVAEARAAAAEASSFLYGGQREVSPVRPYLVGRCTGCGACAEACPVKVITLPETGSRPVEPRIESLGCTGCGACVAVCPEEALDLHHYTRSQLMAEVEALVGGERRGEGDVLLLGVCGEKVAYPAMDAVGVARSSYPVNLRVMRLPSAARFGVPLMLHALASGADGLLLCEAAESPEAAITQRHIEATRQTLANLGIEQERIAFQPLLLPMAKALPRLIQRRMDALRQLGPIGKAQRRSIKQTASGEGMRRREEKP